jgi:hypothetical protein
MIITLRRIAMKDTYTIGKLYIDGVYFCDTVEDKDRGLDDSMEESVIKERKVYGETAIPLGTYKVEITYSPKFKKNLPLLYNVKGFEGIRIHSGNTAKDSLGCIIVGKNKKVGMVLDSRSTMTKLMKILTNTKENIWLTIRR